MDRSWEVTMEDDNNWETLFKEVQETEEQFRSSAEKMVEAERMYLEYLDGLGKNYHYAKKLMTGVDRRIWDAKILIKRPSDYRMKQIKYILMASLSLVFLVFLFAEPLMFLIRGTAYLF